MQLTNSTKSYGAVTKTFHWLIALLILSNIPLGIIANGMAAQLRDPTIPSTEADFLRTATLFSIHKTLGVTIFFVALARILWALSQPKPGLLNADNRLESTLAEIVHWLLYLSLLFVPLTGWIYHAATTGFAPIWWPLGQSLPFVPKSEAVSHVFRSLHIAFERVLVISIVLHVAGALKHHFIDRDHTLRRMWPAGGDGPEPPATEKSWLPALVALLIFGGAIGIGLGNTGRNTAVAPQAPVPDGAASDWVVTDGTLALRFAQMNNPVEGRFADWNAAISFDEPAGPGPAGYVDVVVSINSLTLGPATDQAMGPDFFDAGNFPTARFSGEILRTETGYVATGPLTIKDKTVDIELPFTLEIDGDTARMTGSVTLDRLAFGIGATLPDEATLGFPVEVTVDLVATRDGSVVD